MWIIVLTILLFKFGCLQLYIQNIWINLTTLTNVISINIFGMCSTIKVRTRTEEIYLSETWRK